MDILGADGGHKNAASNNELAKAMFEGTHAYRRKLKLPEMNEYAEKVKAAVRRRALSRRAVPTADFFFLAAAVPRCAARARALLRAPPLSRGPVVLGQPLQRPSQHCLSWQQRHPGYVERHREGWCGAVLD